MKKLFCFLIVMLITSIIISCTNGSFKQEQSNNELLNSISDNS